MLHVYLGDETFDDMVGAYIAAHPSRTPNARWISRQVPTFLASREPYCEHAEIADLAAIEQTLNDAFDAADATSISLFDLSSVDPQAWPDLVFTPHPSIRRLALRSNAFDIWSALAHDAEPPEALEHKCAQHVIVWRAEGTAMLRILGREEAMMWDEAANGVRFGVLCEMVATNDAPDTAAMRAATYLRGWIEGGLLATATMRPRHQR